MEHLRPHERVTQADRVVERAVERFHLHGAPKVTHYIAAEVQAAAYALVWCRHSALIRS
jgi:Transmembrane secretion effector